MRVEGLRAEGVEPSIPGNFLVIPSDFTLTTGDFRADPPISRSMPFSATLSIRHNFKLNFDKKQVEN